MSIINNLSGKLIDILYVLQTSFTAAIAIKLPTWEFLKTLLKSRLFNCMTFQIKKMNQHLPALVSKPKEPVSSSAMAFVNSFISLCGLYSLWCFCYEHISSWLEYSQWIGWELWGGRTTWGQDSIFTPLQCLELGTHPHRYNLLWEDRQRTLKEIDHCLGARLADS